MSDIIALISIIIALMTFIYTIYYNKQQIDIQLQHNKISVVPRISSNLIINTDREFSGIGIINDGLGPAIIKEISFFKNNKKIEEKYSIGSQKKLLDSFSLSKDVDLMPISAGKIIKVDTPFWFYKTKTNNNKEIVSRLFDMYANSTIYLCYCSLYQECFKKAISGKNEAPVKLQTCK